MESFQAGAKKIGGVVCSQSNLGSKGKEAQRRLTAIALIITLSPRLSPNSCFPRSCHVKSVGVSKYCWLSLLPLQGLFSAFSLQRSRATCRPSSNLPYLHISGLDRCRNRFKGPVLFRLCFNEYPSILLHLRSVFVSDHHVFEHFIYKALYIFSLHHTTLLYSYREVDTASDERYKSVRSEILPHQGKASNRLNSRWTRPLR